MSMFINREIEIEELNEIFSSKKAELVLIYGRRRVGKSKLLIEAIKNKRALYLLADMSENILEILSNQIKDKFAKFSNWEDFFEFILKSDYDIIIIDEFQYLYNINKAWPTILQRWWERLKETNKKIILCGSIISTIYRIAKGYGSALYGRKTKEIEITPLNFFAVRKFLRKYNLKDSIKTYFILGGIPRHLEEIDTDKSFEENIKEKLIRKTSFLYNEVENLLFEEFRNSTPYISILSAISEGNIKFNDISQVSKITTNKLSKYLSILERVKIISKNIPVTEKKTKSKITRYKIIDLFYRFWFKFIFKNKSQIELGLNEEVYNNISKELNSYFGFMFEELCKELLLPLGILKLSKIGKWWHKDKEIDIVALNEDSKEILFCECKWKDNVNVEKIIKELIEKSKFVPWNNEERKEYFAVFAKSFKKKISSFEGKKVYCFDLKDIGKLLRK